MSAAILSGGVPDLVDLLLRNTKLTEEQLEEARGVCTETGEPVVDKLVSLGQVTPDEVLEALSQQLSLPIRPRITASAIDEELIEQIPIGFAKDNLILPIAKNADGSVSVAVCNPLDTAPLDDLRLLFGGAEVRLELANQRTILGAINEV